MAATLREFLQRTFFLHRVAIISLLTAGGEDMSNNVIYRMFDADPREATYKSMLESKRQVLVDSYIYTDCYPENVARPTSVDEVLPASDYNNPVPLEVRDEGIRGRGVIVKQATSKHQFIGLIHGEVISVQRQAYRNCVARTFGFSWPVSFDVEAPSRTLMWSYALDTTVYLNALALANHSCSPNARFYILWHNQKVVLGVYALKDIAQYDFIHFNYWYDAPEEVAEAFPQGCFCSARNCKFPAKDLLVDQQ